VSEFAAAEMVVTTGPLAGTRWSNDFAPYQVGIMDAFHEPRVEIVVVMGSSQWGKTAIAVNMVAYHIKHDPCTIQVVEPTVDPMAKDFGRNRLEPAIAASPALFNVVGTKRAKDSANTVLQKSFKGGSLTIGGANSAASLAARSTRLLVLDEIDRYPPELPGEGSTIAIAIKRTTSYRNRRRILMLSSPTLEGAPIHAWFQQGDQRRWYVPCPSCGTFHPFEWSNVRWIDNDPATARLHCPACDYAIDEAQRVAILKHGKWVAEHPEDRVDKSIVSYHIWEAYSPLSSLREIVTTFLRARAAQKAGDRSELHTWENTTLGEPVEPDKGDGVEPSGLLLRRESYAGVDLPDGVCCLTAGIDTQDDRLEALVYGWGIGEESWLVDRQVFPGDTSQPEPWDAVGRFVQTTYQHASGDMLPIHASCIDSAGHRTELVYAFAFRWAASRVFATIGRDGQRPLVSSPSPRRWGRGERQVALYTIGVDSGKALFLSRLNVTEKGPGHIHLPATDWCDEELVAQMTSERLKKKWKKGIPTQVWVKVRARNEGLDCSVLALSALRLLNPKLEHMAQLLAAGNKAKTTPATTGRRTTRSAYLGRG
jgi:phage terminase large subunit GpA-like protein